MKIARVSENGKTWLWRYDWLTFAIDREKKRCEKLKTYNVLSKIMILHVFDDGR